MDNSTCMIDVFSHWCWCCAGDTMVQVPRVDSKEQALHGQRQVGVAHIRSLGLVSLGRRQVHGAIGSITGAGVAWATAGAWSHV